MPHVAINGLHLYFERHGESGDPLVLVHGFTGDLDDWRHQVAEFAPTHRVLALELRGHGRSHAPADRAAYAILHMADDVEAVATHAGFDSYHLVGHSMGGTIAQEIALRSPHRLLSLTLHDTGPTFAFRQVALAKYWEMRKRIAEEQGMAALAALDSRVPPPPHSTEERRAYERARLSAMSVDAFIGASDALDAWPGTVGRLGSVRTPTLVIYGELDGLLVDASKHLAAAIAGAELVSVPEAAHAPQIERPELFNAALRRHLERNRARPD